jgi:hypothetical protein
MAYQAHLFDRAGFNPQGLRFPGVFTTATDLISDIRQRGAAASPVRASFMWRPEMARSGQAYAIPVRTPFGGRAVSVPVSFASVRRCSPRTIQLWWPVRIRFRPEVNADPRRPGPADRCRQTPGSARQPSTPIGYLRLFPRLKTPCRSRSGAPLAPYRPSVARGSRPMKAARRCQSSAPGAGQTSAPKGTPGPAMLRY